MPIKFYDNIIKILLIIQNLRFGQVTSLFGKLAPPGVHTAKNFQNLFPIICPKYFRNIRLRKYGGPLIFG